jgi:hypothetical protein
MECLGQHNKPKAEVHLGHKLTGPKEEEEEEEETGLKRRWPNSSVLPTFTQSERAKPQITSYDAARTLCYKVATVNSLFLSICL